MSAAAAEVVAPAGAEVPHQAELLTVDAVEFVAELHRRFDATRRSLLRQRAARQRELDAGARPDFLADTKAIREGSWTVAPAPRDLVDRRVEITGPVDRKMMINALNSGARVFMADFEDALSPTWSNVIEGQQHLRDAVRRQLAFTAPDGRRYALADETATLVVRPRGWHLQEAHLVVDGSPVSASLFDFGLHFFHNARELVERGSGPYFYLPKLEGHREARLWNDVFVAAQEMLGIPRGTIRATVLIETILAAFEMNEILYELREHAAGLNAGRWDYIFSAIKKFRNRSGMTLPDRARITMTVPFMRAYTELLVRTCHRRGAHAIGGMAAFIPSRRDPAVNETAIRKVREDKLREAGDGFDGTWVAHPDLVPVARSVFDEALGDRPHQQHCTRDDVSVGAADLRDLHIPNAQVTDDGVRNDIAVALQYIEAWLGGSGAVAINNLMEDTATAEISRALLWQWRRHGAAVEGVGPFTAEYYRRVRDEELRALAYERGDVPSRYDEAAELLDRLVLDDDFVEFLTLAAYRTLERSADSQEG